MSHYAYYRRRHTDVSERVLYIRNIFIAIHVIFGVVYIRKLVIHSYSCLVCVLTWFSFFQELFALIYWDEEDSVSVCPEGSIDPSLKDMTVGALCSVRIGNKCYNGELAANHRN